MKLQDLIPSCLHRDQSQNFCSQTISGNTLSAWDVAQENQEIAVPNPLIINKRSVFLFNHLLCQLDFWSQYLCAHGSGFPAGAWGWTSSHSRYIHRASLRCGCVCGPSVYSHLGSSSRRTHTQMGGPLLKCGEKEERLLWKLVTSSLTMRARNMKLCLHLHTQINLNIIKTK